MVKSISKQDEDLIEKVIEQAEKNTNAEIVLAIIDSSDHYLDFTLLYGFLFSDFLILGLWLTSIKTNFLDLIFIQLSFLLLLFFIPIFRYLFWYFIPKSIFRYRSKKRALE